MLKTLLKFFLSYFLGILDRLIYTFFGSRPRKELPELQSIELSDYKEIKGETKPRVHYESKNGLLNTIVDGLYTINELWEWAIKSHPNRPCMGKRTLLREIKKETVLSDGRKKVWVTPEFKEGVTYSTFKEVNERVVNLSNGLVSFCKLKKGDRIGIYEETRPKWMITAQAAFRNGLEIVTCYSNLGEEALSYSIIQTNMKAIVCNAKNVDLIKKNQKEYKNLQYIIYIDDYNGKIDNDSEDIKIIQFEELEKIGEKNKYEPTPPTKNDIAVIMYTSGSTGTPKGVVVLHRNLCAIVASFNAAIGGLTEKDIHLGFLPLAHILELAAEISFLIIGGRIGYGSPRTLTDEGAQPIGDLKAIKPTVFIGVPRIYDTIKKGALEKVSKGGFIVNLLFEIAKEAKIKAINENRDTPLFNLLVFNKFKGNVGGNVKVMISGGAPFSKETHEFMRVCFSCPVIQGYGLTETCAGGTIQPFDHHDYLNAGIPVRSSMVKLVDVPDMGYYTSDNPPKGEICIKGENVSAGYLNEEKKTKEVFDEDGWFHTGDIGTFLKNGTLKITDRKKNLVKMAHGEYVAIEHLECIYGVSPFIFPNGICIYGDSFKNSLVAIILLKESYVKEWMKQNNIKCEYEEVVNDKSLKNEILKSLKEIGQREKKKTFELITAIHLTTEEWTPDNQMLTSAMKLNRQKVIEKFKNDIDNLYKNETN